MIKNKLTKINLISAFSFLFITFIILIFIFKSEIKNKVFFIFYKDQVDASFLKKDLKLEKLRFERGYLDQTINEILPYLNEIKLRKSIKIITKTSKLSPFSNTEYKIEKYTNPILQNMGPRSYIAKYNKNIYLLTGTGALFFGNLNKLNNNYVTLKKINTNFNKIVDKNYINEEKTITTDILIDNGIFYIAYRKKIKDWCYEISLLAGDLINNNIEFVEIFSTDECQPWKTGAEGGKISTFKDNKLLLTIGDHGSFEKQYNNNPQKLDNLIGKIISLDLNSFDHEILSIGHRNPQGLFYDKELDIIFSSEHGPKGGDEVNINISPNSKNIKNYGWAISSYGEHYSPNEKLEKIAPLNKSHSDFGFEEPIKNFNPSIGISQIALFNDLEKSGKLSIYVSALGYDIIEGDMSVHELVLNKKLSIIEEKIIPVGERIRDIFIEKELPSQIYLYLESSGSIAIMDISKN